MINSKTIEPFKGGPDKERLLAAFKRKPVDRVPNFEILYEDAACGKDPWKVCGKHPLIRWRPCKRSRRRAGTAHVS